MNVSWKIKAGSALSGWWAQGVPSWSSPPPAGLSTKSRHSLGGQAMQAPLSQTDSQKYGSTQPRYVIVSHAGAANKTQHSQLSGPRTKRVLSRSRSAVWEKPASQPSQSQTQSQTRPALEACGMR